MGGVAVGRERVGADGGVRDGRLRSRHADAGQFRLGRGSRHHRRANRRSADDLASEGAASTTSGVRIGDGGRE